MNHGKISYEPFFRTMQKKNISTYRLFKMGFSDRTYYRMKDGESVKTDTIAKLCDLLNCEVQDIIEYVKE
ncbi:MAG: helix-turn-helix transcriptional regulator [Oscillospiraceae bacterium]|nr:helix-turn-helix transcriptional regulator [Oscillospiraceae bacterium]